MIDSRRFKIIFFFTPFTLKNAGNDLIAFLNVKKCQVKYNKLIKRCLMTKQDKFNSNLKPKAPIKFF